MARKKAQPKTETYKITPELHHRATELLVDVLLRIAEEIGASGARTGARRAEHGIKPHTSAGIVTELAAQMSVMLARQIADGGLIAMPTTKP